MFVKVDWTTRTHHVLTLADHHDEISTYALHAGVPQEIVLQYETAKCFLGAADGSQRVCALQHRTAQLGSAILSDRQ
jgi:hypothetical protein